MTAKNTSIITGLGGRMGMYSQFDYEEITVVDSKGLTEWLLREKDNLADYFYEDFLNGIIDGKQYSFQNWDDIKLISYWYKNQVDFLIELGKYIRGYVKFNFETGDECAEIKFQHGKTIINLGNMEYKEFKAEEMRG